MSDWVDIQREISWLGPESMFLVQNSAQSVLTTALLKLGFKIVVLDGAKIGNEPDFFREIASALNFPSYFGNNWDAFVDSAGELPYRSPEKRLAIIWKQADQTLRKSLYVFLKAAHELLNVASDLGHYDDPERMQVEVFFLGEPPKFNKSPFS